MTEAERELAKRVYAAIYEMAITGKSVSAQVLWLQTRKQPKTGEPTQ